MDVLVADVDTDEGPQFSTVVEEVGTQPGMRGDEVVEQALDAVGRDSNRPVPPVNLRKGVGMMMEFI